VASITIPVPALVVDQRAAGILKTPFAIPDNVEAWDLAEAFVAAVTADFTLASIDAWVVESIRAFVAPGIDSLEYNVFEKIIN
jgi:hypothetical protein